jgi:hypothetical protein
MTGSDRYFVAALATLIVLQVTMLSALYAGIRPHPPEATPLFGMAPFIGASVSLALAAAIVGPGTTATGRVLSLLAAISALVSFGPQKYLDPQIGQIWPAVFLGQLAALSIILLALRATGSRVPSGAPTVTLEAR